MEEEDELDEALLTRQERKALRKKEKEEKAAAKAAAKEAARQQAIAEAKKVKLSQGVNGVPEEYPDLEAALAAAISKAENQDPAEDPSAADSPDPNGATGSGKPAGRQPIYPGSRPGPNRDCAPWRR